MLHSRALNILNHVHIPQKTAWSTWNYLENYETENERVIFVCLAKSRKVWILIRHQDTEDIRQQWPIFTAQIHEHWLHMCTERLTIRSYEPHMIYVHQTWSTKAMMLSWTPQMTMWLGIRGFSTDNKAYAIESNKLAISPKFRDLCQQVMNIAVIDRVLDWRLMSEDWNHSQCVLQGDEKQNVEWPHKVLGLVKGRKQSA